MNQDRIQIVEPNGVERARPLSRSTLTIGRGPENDLILNYELVSRHHAKITYEAGVYYVTDLDSANGTYLVNRELPPNQPVAWTSNKPLQIGEVVIYLEQQGGQQAVRPDETISISGAPASDMKQQTSLLRWILVALAGLFILTVLSLLCYLFLIPFLL